jgi:phage protein D
MTLELGRSHPYVITIDGTPLLPDYDANLMEIVVDLRNDMPGMCTLRFQDKRNPPAEFPTFTYTDLPVPFIVGGLVAVSFVGANPSALPLTIPKPVFVGEITGLETEFNDDGEVFLTVRAYHRTHRLHRGKKSEAYLFQPDNLIVQQICTKAGVPMTAMPTGGPNEYVLQNNQTDWEFIQERAKRIGFEISATPLGTFKFGPKGVPSGTPVSLKYGSNLREFTGQVSSLRQVSVVEIDVKDPKLPSPVPAPALAPVPPTPLGGNSLRIMADYGAGMTQAPTAKKVIADQPQANIGTAIAQVAAEVKDILRSYVQAEGVALGDPGLVPGAPVVIESVGVKFTGPYILTSATHIFNSRSGYMTRFTVSGSEPDTILGLVEDPARSPSRVHGVMIGTVSNNMDPLSQGRVKVMFPNLGSAPPILSNWCRIAAGSGGLMSGSYFIPDVGTEVLVAFEHGDVNFPYVIGTLWNAMNLPPKPSSAVVIGGKVVERIIQTPMGLKITMVDMPGKMGIELSDKLGMNSIAIDAVKGAVAIKALTDVTIDSLNFKVNSKALIDMKALASAKLTGVGGLELVSKAVTKIEGTASVDIKGGMMVSVKSLAGGSVVIQGPEVNINNGALEIM